MEASPEIRIGSSLLRFHALAFFVGGAAMAVSAVAGSVGCHELPWPFVWRDVGLVYFLAALPLSASLAAWLVGRADWNRRLVLLLASEIAVLMLVPSLYITARSRSDAARFAGFVEQSRLGEARQLLARLLALTPGATWQGHGLASAKHQIEAAVRQIEQRTLLPLEPDAPDEQRLDRARDLAMLGRAGEALAVLDAGPPLEQSPEAANLRGTIYESRGEWRAASDWYSRAIVRLQSAPASPLRTAELVRAATGVGFTQRKLGRLTEAEAAYQQRLALSPTAESHFLLAQFYEDTQKTAAAHAHARQAMALDPAQFGRAAEQLIDKLATLHFGCLGVFRHAQR